MPVFDSTELKNGVHGFDGSFKATSNSFLTSTIFDAIAFYI